MKLKPILTALAVAVAALAQPAWANFQFTQNEKGEVTHYNGIPLPPIATVEEAKAQAQWEIAAAKKAQESEQAAAASASNLQSEIGNHQFFFTGKPYLEETGQYLFLFRHYDPELARWTTADPSGFPDGANNVLYVNNMPLFGLDIEGLKIFLYNKEVVASKMHAYIYYDDIYACGGYHKHTGTVSGQPQFNPPTLLQGFGKLVSQPGSDMASARLDEYSLNYSTYGWKSEWGFLKDLLGAMNSYANNLPYHPTPTAGSGHYNSNGYISGILNALGISTSMYTATANPGWDVPISLSYTPQFKNLICE